MWNARSALSSLSYSEVSRGLTSCRMHSPQDRNSIGQPRSNLMNTIIYIVGLVVIIGFILSYFGFR